MSVYRVSLGRQLAQPDSLRACRYYAMASWGGSSPILSYTTPVTRPIYWCAADTSSAGSRMDTLLLAWLGALITSIQPSTAGMLRGAAACRARYVDWTFTTPLLLLDILLMTGMPFGEARVACLCQRRCDLQAGMA